MSDSQQLLLVFGFVMLGIGAQLWNMHKWEKQLNEFYVKLIQWHKTLTEMSELNQKGNEINVRWAEQNKAHADKIIEIIDSFNAKKK